MAYDPNALYLGASNISYGGQDFGFTRDGVQLDIKTTTKRMDIDHFSSVETIEIVLSRAVSVKFKLLEISIPTVLLATAGSGSGPSGAVNGRIGAELPTGAGRLMHNAGRELRLHPVGRAAADPTGDFVFPNAIWSGNISHVTRYDDVRMIEVEFFAYRDVNSDALMRFGV